LDEAERRLRRVVDFLGDRKSFSNYRNSANIGLALVALARGETASARHMLESALMDPVHLYPYTHVHAILGLARIAHLQGDAGACAELLRQALRFAGRRSLLEEYVAAVAEIARLRPAGAPLKQLVASVLEYAQSIGLESAVQALHKALQEPIS
jgi:ATP/maltotriose-dependent transcriptional regulator MalT